MAKRTSTWSAFQQFQQFHSRVAWNYENERDYAYACKKTMRPAVCVLRPVLLAAKYAAGRCTDTAASRLHAFFHARNRRVG